MEPARHLHLLETLWEHPPLMLDSLARVVFVEPPLTLESSPWAVL